MYKPTGKERFFGEDELIVSKTDIRGKITYANDVFQRLAGYTEEELLGAPHSILRHPDMPRCVFKLLWDTITRGSEIFAYVINMCKGGDHYWVFAHVTPSFDKNGAIVGFHSNRRVPDRKSVEAIQPVYKLLLSEEQKHKDPRKGLEASAALLHAFLSDKKVSYEELAFSL